MAARVRTTRQADADLQAAYLQGTVEFSPAQAERYLAGLRTTFQLLADHPRTARERRKFSPPVRLHAWRAHMIACLEQPDGILILRVLHGRREWERHL